MTTLFRYLPPWRRSAINTLLALVVTMLVTARAITGEQGAAVAALVLAGAQLAWILACAISDRTGPTPAWRQAIYATLSAGFGVSVAFHILSPSTASTWAPLACDLAAAILAVISTPPAGAGEQPVTARPIAVAYAAPRPAGDPKALAAYAGRDIPDQPHDEPPC